MLLFFDGAWDGFTEDVLLEDWVSKELFLALDDVLLG